MKLQLSYCRVIRVTFKDEEDTYPKKEEEGWNEPQTGSMPKLKEKERTVGERSWHHMDTDTRMGKGKNVVGNNFPGFISSHSKKCCIHS